MIIRYSLLLFRLNSCVAHCGVGKRFLHILQLRPKLVANLRIREASRTHEHSRKIEMKFEMRMSQQCRLASLSRRAQLNIPKINFVIYCNGRTLASRIRCWGNANVGDRQCNQNKQRVRFYRHLNGTEISGAQSLGQISDVPRSSYYVYV
jgi:hypothetical protein